MTGPSPVVSLRRRAEPIARAHPVAMVAFGTFLYSTSPVMVAASSVSGTVFAFWRLWAGVLIFGALVAARRLTGGTRLPLRAWRWAFASGVLFGTHQLFYFSAVKATSVVDVSLISRLSPLIVGVAAVRMVGERPGRSFVLGAAIAVVGDTDVEGRSLGLRLRGDEHERRGLPLDEAVAELASSFAVPR